MKRLPLLVDDQSSPLVRAVTYLLVPIVLVVALPFLLLLVLFIYLAALVHGARVFVYVVTGKEEPAEPSVQKPHFIDVAPPNTLTNQTSLPRLTDERSDSVGQ